MADQRQTSQPRRRSRGAQRGAPVSPLQAARLARAWTQAQACERAREVCAGSRRCAGGCRLRLNVLSRYETGTHRPTAEHIEALCRVYQMSAEALGLVVWRGTEAMEPQDQKAHAWLREHLRREVCDEVREELRAEVRDEVRELLRGEVRADVRREVGDEIAHEVFLAVTRKLRNLADGDSPTV